MRSLSDFLSFERAGLNPEFCHTYREEFSKSNFWEVSKVFPEDAKSIRVSEGLACSADKVIMENPGIRSQLDSQMFDFVTNAINFYRENVSNFVTFEKDDGYQLLRYSPGSHFRNHVDDSTDRRRTLSVVVGMSDPSEYEGGVLVFQHGQEFKLGMGDVVIFPSCFLYEHGVTDVLSGTRYSLVTWVS
jgi:hypothetical protein